MAVVTSQNLPAEEAIARLGACRERLLAEIGKVIIGQKKVVDDVITSFFAGGHWCQDG